MKKKYSILKKVVTLTVITVMVLCSAMPAFALVPIDHTTDPVVIKGWTRTNFAQDETSDVSVAPMIDYGDTFGAHGLITDMHANAAQSNAIINTWTINNPDYLKENAMRNYFTMFRAGPTFGATQLFSSTAFSAQKREWFLGNQFTTVPEVDPVTGSHPRENHLNTVISEGFFYVWDANRLTTKQELYKLTDVRKYDVEGKTFKSYDIVVSGVASGVGAPDDDYGNPYVVIWGRGPTLTPNIELFGGSRFTQFNLELKYYLHGTSTPAAIKHNIFIDDLDGPEGTATRGKSYQYAGISRASQPTNVKSLFLSKNTKLKYTENINDPVDSTRYDVFTGTRSQSSDNESGAFGALVNKNTLDVLFGIVPYALSSDHPMGSKGHAHFRLGLDAQKFYPPHTDIPNEALNKQVSDTDEIKVKENLLTKRSENFTYTITIPIDAIPPCDDNYSSFVIRDVIHPALNIETIRITSYSKSHYEYGDDGRAVADSMSEWTDTGGFDNSGFFTITKSGTGGNTVTATAKASALTNNNFYFWDGSQRNHGEVRLRIVCTIDPAADLTGLQISDVMAEIPNTADLTTDNGEKHSSAATLVPLTLKKINNANTLSLNNPNEVFTFDVKSQAGPLTGDREKYTQFGFRDNVEPCLSIQSIKVFNESNTDVTNLFTDSTTGNAVRLNATDAALNSTSFYGHIYRMEIKAKINTSVSVSTLIAHGHYNTAKTELTYANTASALFNGSPIATNEVTVKAKVPSLEISKTVSRYENQVGDKFKYTVTVKHKSTSNGDKSADESAKMLVAKSRD